MTGYHILKEILNLKDKIVYIYMDNGRYFTGTLKEVDFISKELMVSSFNKENLSFVDLNKVSVISSCKLTTMEE